MSQDVEAVLPVVESAGRSDSPALLAPSPSPGAIQEFTPDAFRRMLAEETEKHAALEAYIRENLKEGVDFGHIKLHYKECPRPRRDDDSCPVSKPTLFKPGAEKICRLLNLVPAFEPGTPEAIQKALKDNGGELMVICRLINRNGEVKATGMGARGPSDRTGETLNSRIKMALKSAMIDATLRVAALSGIFTQDLEDMASASEPPSTAERAAAPPHASRKALSEKQRGLIFSLARERNFTDEDVDAQCVKNYGTTLSGITSRQASDLIDLIKSLPPKPANPEDRPPGTPVLSEEQVEARIAAVRGLTKTYDPAGLSNLAKLVCEIGGKDEAGAVAVLVKAEAVLKLPRGWQTDKERSATGWSALEQKLVDWTRKAGADRRAAAEEEEVPF